MTGLINPSEYDPSFPGGNYEDWIMLIVDVDQYTPRIISHVIEIQRKMRAVIEGGGKVKSKSSAEAVKALSALIPRTPEKPVKRRKIVND